MSKVSGIYEILNTENGHRYVGSAFDIRPRWNLHRSNLRNNKHHSAHLQSAWNKYGADKFVFSIIETCPIDALYEREQYYIGTLKPEYNGKNVVSPHHALRQPTEEDLIKASSLLHVPYHGRATS